MVPEQAVKRIGEVQFNKYIIDSHVFDEPLVGVYSCFAAYRYPDSDLDWTDEFVELGGGIGKCTFGRQFSPDITHDNRTDTSRLFWEQWDVRRRGFFDIWGLHFPSRIIFVNDVCAESKPEPTSLDCTIFKNNSSLMPSGPPDEPARNERMARSTSFSPTCNENYYSLQMTWTHIDQSLIGVLFQRTDRGSQIQRACGCKQPSTCPPVRLLCTSLHWYCGHRRTQWHARNVNCTGQVSVLLLDLSAACDTIDHKILLDILEYRFGYITGLVLKWYQPYLADQTQTFQVEFDHSIAFVIDCSVPRAQYSAR